MSHASNLCLKLARACAFIVFKWKSRNKICNENVYDGLLDTVKCSEVDSELYIPNLVARARGPTHSPHPLSLSLSLALPHSFSLYLSFFLFFLSRSLSPSLTLTLSLSLSLSLGPLHAPLPHGAVRPHARAGLNPPDPDPVGSEGPEGLRSKGRVDRTMYIRVNLTMYI